MKRVLGIDIGVQGALALLDAEWRGDGRILMLEPRRLATRAAAARMASANPTISSTVSPFMCNATSSAAICASEHSPVRISVITACASARESDWR